MANGQMFRAAALTAASRTLPLGRVVRVCRVPGRCVRVRITDRGPYAKGRILDLSRAAMVAIGGEHAGVVPVSIEAIRSWRQEAGGRHPPGRRP